MKKSMLLVSLIDIDLWNQAQWIATVWGVAPQGGAPPFCAPLFRNERPARAIFDGWHARLGKTDTFEELRVAVIDGPIRGHGVGYSVHVSTNDQGVLVRAMHEGHAVAPDLIAKVGRVNRMTPAPGSPYLPEFRRAFDRTRRFLIMPAIGSPSSPQPIFDLSIEKTSFVYRLASDVGEEDEDRVVFPDAGT